MCVSFLSAVAAAASLYPKTDTISELKLGNGTSVLIFANIASSLPTSVGALLAQNTESDPGNIAIYATAFFLTTLGIIYVQEAERRIPVNYSSRYVGWLWLVLQFKGQNRCTWGGEPVCIRAMLAGASLFITMLCVCVLRRILPLSMMYHLCMCVCLCVCLLSIRYQAGNLARQSYLPFKVNATGQHNT